MYTEIYVKFRGFGRRMYGLWLKVRSLQFKDSSLSVLLRVHGLQRLLWGLSKKACFKSLERV